VLGLFKSVWQALSMVSAHKLPLLVLALGAGFVLPVAAGEVITWTRDLSAPLKLAPEPLLPGLVVVTREAMAGPSARELAEKLRDIQAQHDKNNALLVQETRNKIEALERLNEERVKGLEHQTALRLESTEQIADLKMQTIKSLAASRLDSLERDTAKNIQQVQADLERRTAEKVKAAERSSAYQIEAISAQISHTAQIADLKLNSLETLTKSRMDALAQKTASHIENVEANLERRAADKLAAVEASSAQKIAEIALQNNMKVEALQSATASTLASLYRKTSAEAEAMVQAQAEQFATQLAEISGRVLSPQEVEALAAQKIADAEPAFEALALSTLKDAEGYVRTVARQAVIDKDPAMASALGEAVALALTQEQSPAAFSMRRAIVNELTNVVQGGVSGTTAATTRLGNDMAAVEPAAGNEEVIDAARLRLGRLLNPGVAPRDNATQMATLTPNHDPRDSLISAGRARARTDLMDLRDYKVVLHADNMTLPAILNQIIERAEPFAGPWQVRWRLKPENADLMAERFSLDAETTFSAFVSYLAQYLVNDRGVKLTFSLFDRERVVLVSD
jgi:hypothetical protein